MSYIYKITNKVNGKIYIGQTTGSIEHRLQEHIWNAYQYMSSDIHKHNSRLYQAIVKYGRENFIIEVIKEITEFDNIDDCEIYYIKLYDARNPEIGYNIAEGGNKPPSRLGGRQPESTKQKMSSKQRGKKWYNDGKIEIMVMLGDEPPIGFTRGRLYAGTFSAGAANPMYGKPGVNFGKTLSEETKHKISESKKKLFKNKKSIWYHNDLNEIQIDITATNIPDGYVKGRLKSNLNSAKKIGVLNIETNSYKIYSSMTEASNILHLSAPSIIKSCRNNCIVKYKYLCNYID